MKNLKIILIAVLLCGLFITSVSAAPQLYLDAYNSNLKLNMHMNGTNDGTVFTDETGKVVTNYNTLTKTGIKYLGSASGNLGGTNSYLSLADNVSFNSGSENITVVLWFYPTLATTRQTLIGTTTSDGTTAGLTISLTSDGYLKGDWSNGVDTYSVTGTQVVSLNTWHQAAFTLNQTTWSGYLDGTSIASPTTVTGSLANPAIGWRIGRFGDYTTPHYYQGYIDELFYLNGVALPISTIYPQSVEVMTTIPPTATFTATPTEGVAPLSVQLTETSTSSGTSWQWNATNVTGNNIPFTFNTTSGSPIHVFETTGNYSISLKSTNGGGSNISTQVAFVNVSLGNSITADFTISNTTGFQPLLTHFTDTSTTNEATIDSWNWDFGEGNTSTDQNPDHTYEVTGTHSVNLTITNTSYSLVSTKIQSVTVYKVPNADFSSFNTQGTAPFTTYLYDTSANLNAGPYSYYWDFGDGNTSTGPGALHTYNETGSFTVRHSVTDSITTRWENKTDYITVVPAVVAPTASFYGGPQLGAPPLRVFFTDVSTGSPTGWNWSMGDGTYSESQNPSHIYATSGFFTVSLTATNSAGSNTSTQSNFVMVY